MTSVCEYAYVSRGISVLSSLSSSNAGVVVTLLKLLLALNSSVVHHLAAH